MKRLNPKMPLSMGFSLVLWAICASFLFALTWGVLPAHADEINTITPSLTLTLLEDEPLETSTPARNEVLATLTPSPTSTVTQTPSPTSTNHPPPTNTPDLKNILPMLVGSHAPDELLAKFKVSANPNAINDCLAKAGADVKSEIENSGIFLLTVSPEYIAESIFSLQSCSDIVYVEPNYIAYGIDTIPNDSGFGNQYGLLSIQAPQGWDMTTGSAAVIIAIADTGVDLSHADLSGKIVAGYDFINHDAIAQDDNGHGTHVAGIAAASSNNGIGITGVSWGARIMPVKVLNSGGGGTYSNVAAGIIWAVDHGAHIINLSLGGSSASVTLESAVDYAYGKGVTLVAASGNSGSGFVLYPARYPSVIAVGAVDDTNTYAGFSNYGPEIDVVAPGVSIYSTQLGNNYNYRNGTSMAAPFVSGLAAILRGIPGSGSPDGIAWEIRSTALDLGIPGKDNFYGYGLIQMDDAIALVWVSPTPTPTVTFTPIPNRQSNTYITVAPFDTPTSLPSSTSTMTPSPTNTFLQSVAASATATPYPENLPEVIALTEPENETSVSYLPCWGSVFILAGLVLLWVAGRLGAKMQG